MADYEYTNTTAKSFDAPAEGTYTLTFNGQERQVLVMALGELLASVGREEHLTLTIQQLLARVQAAAAVAAPDASWPDRTNRTSAED